MNKHFNYDDFIFVSALEENLQFNHLYGFWDLEFRDIPSFNSMWWVDPDADGRFFRPLPTFIFSFFFKIAGRDSALYLHLFYVLMHIVAAFTTFVFLKKLTKQRNISILAGFLFLICVHHSMTIGWIATGTDIVCVVFMNLALYNYVKYRQENKLKNQIYSVFFIIAALTCKETAVITPVAIILIELFYFTDGYAVQRVKTLLKNYKYLSGAVILLFAFLIFYKLSGFGVKSIMYNDVFINPEPYLKGLVTGYPIMFLGLLSVVPISFYLFMPDLQIPFVIGGLLMTILFIFALKNFRKDRNVQFAFVLFVLSLLPQLSVDASERQLYYPYTIGAYLISLLILQLPWLKSFRDSGAIVQNGLFRRIFSYYLFVSSVIITLIYAPFESRMFAQSLSAPEKFIKQANDAIGSKQYEHLIYLNTPGSMLTLYISDIHRYYKGEYDDILMLSSFDGMLWMRKNSDSSVSIKTEKKGMLTGMFQRLVRTDPKVVQHRIYRMKDYEAEIVKNTEDALDALEVKFDFRYNLNSTSTVFLYYNGEKIRVWDFSAQPINEWIFVGDSSDVMKSMM
jgi:hypothetical protein